jgi:hypothetical protein
VGGRPAAVARALGSRQACPRPRSTLCSPRWTASRESHAVRRSGGQVRLAPLERIERLTALIPPRACTVSAISHPGTSAPVQRQLSGNDTGFVNDRKWPTGVFHDWQGASHTCLSCLTEAHFHRTGQWRRSRISPNRDSYLCVERNELPKPESVPFSVRVVAQSCPLLKGSVVSLALVTPDDPSENVPAPRLVVPAGCSRAIRCAPSPYRGRVQRLVAGGQPRSHLAPALPRFRWL